MQEDLFKKGEKSENWEISADKMAEITNVYEDRHGHMEYPFNFLHYNAAARGKSEYELKSLHVNKAKKLKELGYDVNYNLEKGLWKINWKKNLDKLKSELGKK